MLYVVRDETLDEQQNPLFALLFTSFHTQVNSRQFCGILRWSGGVA